MSDLTSCAEQAKTLELLTEFGLPPPSRIVLTSMVSAILQAAITGSCLQMVRPHSFPSPCLASAFPLGACASRAELGRVRQVYHWFHLPSRESLSGKLGVLWVTLLSLAQMVASDWDHAELITHYNALLSIFYRQWLIYHLCIFVFSLVLLPVLAVFARRAWILWDRSRLVLWSCAFLIGLTFVTGLALGAVGMNSPWGDRHLFTNDDFLASLPLFKESLKIQNPLQFLFAVSQLCTTLYLCVLICYGVFRHRNGVEQMDTAIAKIIFICSESLIPFVLLATAYLLAISIKGPASLLILLLLTQLTPAVYFHGLMTALVSRERVRTIFSAEPIRMLPSLSSMSPFHPRATVAPSYHTNSTNHRPTGSPRRPRMVPLDDVGRRMSAADEEDKEGLRGMYDRATPAGQTQRGSDCCEIIEILSSGPIDER